MKRLRKILSPVTTKQNIEFGLVLILITSVLAIYTKYNYLVTAILIEALLTLIVPKIFYPFTLAWFGLSKILNAISSRILLTLVFFIVVTPVGIIRKIRKRDNLKLKQFKKGKGSVMVIRDHQYLPDDLLHTF